jgi:hypothetical protein
MVNISERPPEVEDRAVPGHFEGDLIIGARGASAVGTLVERTTRFVLLLHLPNGHSAKEVEAAMRKEIKTLPKSLMKTITYRPRKRTGSTRRSSLILLASRSSSAIPIHLGNGGVTKIPMDFSVNTYPRALTFLSTLEQISSASKIA